MVVLKDEWWVEHWVAVLAALLVVLRVDWLADD